MNKVIIVVVVRSFHSAIINSLPGVSLHFPYFSGGNLEAMWLYPCLHKFIIM